MKTIKYKPFQTDPETEQLLDLGPEDFFLDIETTGLSPKWNPIYLIGVGTWDALKKEGQVLQFFAEKENEEREILSRFLDFASKKKKVVTFNGNRFDLPYVAERLKRNGLENSVFSSLERRDLYLDFKPAKKKYDLPSLRQKAIEDFLGISREDQMNGGELIPVYKKYASSPSEEDRHLLLLHNENDVEGMYPLFRMYPYLNIQEAHVSIREIQKESENQILFFGTTDLTLPSSVRYRSDSYLIDLNGQEIKGALFPEEKELVYALPHPERYVYLLEEDRVIPKVLASSLPRGRYRKAKKSECVAPSSGYFLPLPGKAGRNTLPFSTERIYETKGKPLRFYLKAEEKELTPKTISGYLEEILREKLS